MELSRAILPTPLGDMLALDSGDGLCALEFMGPKERLPRLEARLKRHFPPHDIVDCDTPDIARTRRWTAALRRSRAATRGSATTRYSFIRHTAARWPKRVRNRNPP